MLLCDTGTKNVAKELRKITEGRVRDRNLTWFRNWWIKVCKVCDNHCNLFGYKIDAI